MVVLYCPFWSTLVFHSYLHSFLLCKPEDADFFSDSCCVAFFNLTSRTTLHSHCFAWRQAKQRSLTFQFVVTRGPRDLLESIAVNIKFLFTYVMGMVFFGTQTRVTKKKTRGCTSTFCWWNGKRFISNILFQIGFSARLHSIHPILQHVPQIIIITCSYFANENTFLCLLFCYKKHTVNNA